MIFVGVGTDSNTAQAATASQLTATASKYIGIPYVFGGTTTRGLDCSGFTQLVFKQLGYTINRTAAAQYTQGTAVSKANLKVGDLVFFNTTGRVSHVGIYYGNNKFIHAGSSTGVIVASLSSSYWAPRYVGAKRVATIGSTMVASTVNNAEVKNAAIDFSIYASRGEVALQLAESMGLDTSNTNSPFPDVKSTAKYAGATTALHKLGVFGGDDNGKFNPGSPLTRAEMSKVLVAAFNLQQQGKVLSFTDAPASHWAHEDISILASNGVAVGIGNGKFGTNDHVKLTQLTSFITRIN